MDVVEVAVSVGAAALVAGLVWFFFGPKKAGVAAVRDGAQEIGITVRGGYSPDVMQVSQGMPVRLVFDRQEGGECTSQVVFPDFGVRQALPEYETTVVELTPQQAGEYEFACGMNMVRGRLVVAAAPDGTPPEADNYPTSTEAAPETAPVEAGVAHPASGEDAEAAARRAEISSLARRVLVGAVLTAPVLLAVNA